VEPQQAISANTLLGDPTRRPITLDVEATISPESPEPSAEAATPATPPTTNRVAGVTVFEISTATAPIPPSTEPTQPQQVYGQTYLNTLLDTLLPHRQALNRQAENPPASTDS